jgi:hypothetical protein
MCYLFWLVFAVNICEMSPILKFLLSIMSTCCNKGIVSYAYLISELSFTNLSYIKCFQVEKEGSNLFKTKIGSNLFKTKINLHYTVCESSLWTSQRMCVAIRKPILWLCMGKWWPFIVRIVQSACTVCAKCRGFSVMHASMYANQYASEG